MEVRYVEWVDSLGSHGWDSLKEAREMRPMAIKSVGFVIAEDADYVTLLQSYDERASGEPQGDHVTSIPTAAITKSRTLRK